MKKLITTFLFLLIANFSYGQVFTQTFVDRCTNQIQVVTANFQTGSATVAFYSRVRTFTYQEFVSGVLQAWLNETYAWYNALSPCSTTTTQATQAQQQAQQAQQQATQASQAATNATSSASSAATTANTATTGTTGTTGTTQTTTGGTTNETSGNTNTSTDNTDTSNSSGSTEGGTSGETGSGEQGGGEEGSGGTESEGSGGSEEETKTEESSEEVKEESKEESKEEENKEESKEEKEEEKSEEESEEDSEESSEESDDEEEGGEKKKMTPIQLKADMMAMQTPFGNYNAVLNIGASQSSIFGDVSYNVNAMVFDNLKQVSLMGARSKVHIVTPNYSTLNHDTHQHYGKDNEVTSNDPQTPPEPYVSHISASTIGYSNNFGYSTILLSQSYMKPFKNGLVIGGGVSWSTTFVSTPVEDNMMISYNLLATKPFQLGSRITYSPAVIWTQTPYMGKPTWPTKLMPWGLDFNNELNGQRISGMAILANSFTIQLTRRFSFNAGWTIVKSTDSNFPMINSFMIGAKLPF